MWLLIVIMTWAPPSYHDFSSYASCEAVATVMRAYYEGMAADPAVYVAPTPMVLCAVK